MKNEHDTSRETLLTKSEIDFLLRAATKNRDISASLSEIPNQRWKSAHIAEVKIMDTLITKLTAMKERA